MDAHIEIFCDIFRHKGNLGHAARKIDSVLIDRSRDLRRQLLQHQRSIFQNFIDVYPNTPFYLRSLHRSRSGALRGDEAPFHHRRAARSERQRADFILDALRAQRADSQPLARFYPLDDIRVHVIPADIHGQPRYNSVQRHPRRVRYAAADVQTKYGIRFS